MPRRTMTITRIWAHPRGDRKTEVDLSKLPETGGDLLYLFRGFAADVTPNLLLKTATESFANPIDVKQSGRTVTLCVEVGRYGEAGTITDVTTMNPVGSFRPNDATSVKTHGVLLLPKGSSSALLFVERSANQSGTLRVLELFVDRFALAYPDFKLETEPVVESEAWLRRASLVRVSASRIRKSIDIADVGDPRENISEIGELAHTLKPPHGKKALPRWLYDRLVEGEIQAGELLAFRDQELPEEVEVTLEHDGQQKTFVLGREKRPSISWLLSTSGEQARSLDNVRTFVLERAPDLFKRFGVDWKSSFAIGEWTAEQLQARLVNANEQQT